MNRSLIYGKNETERIVAIEAKDDSAILFRELEDGTIDQLEVPHKYWILSNRPHSNGWAKLNGNQYYKWGKQYTKLKDYINDKKGLKKNNADIYSIANAAEAMQIKDGYTFFKGMEHTNISILCFDIEATGLDHDKDAKVLCISNTYRSNNGDIIKRLFSYDDYEHCAEMIDSWAEWVRELDPSILAAHNGITYDLPYLNYCHSRYSDTGIQLGRDGSAISFNTHYEAKFRVDGSRSLHYHKCSIYGRQYIDTMFLAYNYDRVERKYQSYGLKAIIEMEGKVKEGRIFYDASQIRFKYKDPEEWKKIKEYCIDDADDVLTVYDMAIPPFFYMTQMIPKPFQVINESASGSQLNALMVRSYLQNRHSIPKADTAVEFEGAISFGEPGIYQNAVSLDIASLYPSIMLQYDIYSKSKDPNRHMLGFLEYMRAERLVNKKLAKETGKPYYKHLDGSYKILINSLYGFMGATGLNYNFPSGAAETTRRGREILTESIEWGKTKGYTVPKVDTDSITIWNNGKRFETDKIDDLINEINSILPEQINFELDACYDSIIVFKAKNYAYLEEGEITTKGSALKASTKCQALKDFLKQSIEMMLKGSPTEDLQGYYMNHVHEICDLKDISRWAARKTLSSTMQESERSNETKIMDAIADSEYREGDRFYTFYLPDDTLCLVENFTGEYNKKRLFKNLFDTIMIFGTVIPNAKELFLNYSLKRNEKYLPGYIEPVKPPKVSKQRKKKAEKIEEVVSE
jgi:DNA polymerase I